MYICISNFACCLTILPSWGLHRGLHSRPCAAEVNFLVVLSLLVSIGQALPGCKSWWKHVQI